MSFFDDIVKYTSPAGYWYESSKEQNQPGQPGPTDRRNTFTPRQSRNQGVTDLINPIYNTEGARDYGSTFDTAYENLGQPSHDTGRDDVYVGGTRALASAFADRVFQQTGSLPTEDQVRQFVGQNLTPGFAQKFILGMAPDQINGMADEYIRGNPDALSNPGTIGAAKSAEEQRILGLNEQLDKIYDAGKSRLTQDTEDAYGAQKSSVANDLAGQGMLTSPNSRISLDTLEGNKSKALTSGLTSLAGQRAAGGLDLAKTIEDLLQRNKDRNQNAYQFGKTFAADREDAYFNQGNERKKLTIAEQIGRQQAENSKPGTLDYINTALNGASTAAKAYYGGK